MGAPVIDVAKAREVHGLAQARAESARADRLRCGTVSYRQGHRAQFWVGFDVALGRTSRNEIPEPVLRESERYAPKMFAQGQTEGYWDGVDFALSLGGETCA